MNKKPLNERANELKHAVQETIDDLGWLRLDADDTHEMLARRQMDMGKHLLTVLDLLKEKTQ